MNNANWTLLSKFPDLIMRDALLSRLAEVRIEAYAPDRDVIVNVSSSPNLSLEGYSALFDGYPVYVDRTQLDRAKVLLKEVEIQAYAPSIEAVDHAKKFYFAAVMSFMVPGILHAIAFYHLYQALKKKQSFKPIKTSFSVFVLVCSFFMLVSLILNTDLGT